MSGLFRKLFVFSFFYAIGLSSQGYAASLSDLLHACRLRLAEKNLTTFKIVPNPKIEKKAPQIILDMDDPDLRNRIKIAKIAQIFETHLDLNRSLEYVPHTLVAEVHTKIDAEIDSRQTAFMAREGNNNLASSVNRAIKNTFTKLRGESKSFRTNSISQLDFLYFAENAARLFASIDEKGRVTPKGQNYASQFFGGIYSRTRAYEGPLRRLVKENLFIPTVEDFTIADLNLASAYPTYFIRIFGNYSLDSEDTFRSDLSNNLILNSRFNEINGSASRGGESVHLTASEVAALKTKIFEKLSLLMNINNLERQRKMPLFKRRLISLILFYLTYESETTSLSLFTSKDFNLAGLAEDFPLELTHGFKQMLLARLRNPDSLGAYLKNQPSVTYSDVNESLKAILEALQLTSRRLLQISSRRKIGV